MRFKTPGALPKLLQGLMAIRQPLRKRQQHQSELTHMNARELSDLGIGRSDIPALLYRPAEWLADRTRN
jgi:uncharacterized protein YjiS (DUF1127 family)